MTARHRTDDSATDELPQPTTREQLLAAAHELEQTGSITGDLPPAVDHVIGPLRGLATARAAATALRQAVAAADRFDELLQSSGRIIRNGAATLELGNTWGEDTALMLLSQPVLREALRALTLIQLLQARHVEVPWGGSSESTVCGCGAPWPCPEASLLGGVA